MVWSTTLRENSVQKKRHAQSQTRLDSKQTSQRRPAQDRPRSRQPAKVPRPRHPRPRNPPHAHTKAASYHHQTPTPSMQPTLKCATEMCVLSRPARGPVTLLVFPPQFPRCTSSTPHSFPILFFLIKQCVERLTLVRPPRH